MITPVQMTASLVARLALCSLSCPAGAYQVVSIHVI